MYNLNHTIHICDYVQFTIELTLGDKSPSFKGACIQMIQGSLKYSANSSHWQFCTIAGTSVDKLLGLSCKILSESLFCEQSWR